MATQFDKYVLSGYHRFKSKHSFTTHFNFPAQSNCSQNFQKDKFQPIHLYYGPLSTYGFMSAAEIFKASMKFSMLRFIQCSNIHLFHLWKLTEQKSRDPKDPNSFLPRLFLLAPLNGTVLLCFLPQRPCKDADITEILKSIPIKYNRNQSKIMCCKEKRQKKPFASVPPVKLAVLICSCLILSHPLSPFSSYDISFYEE